ncbi:hypothetical protein [Roseomonas chloroacetimidivorans]|uniref:hypothetical protein n=1 Tax=Roseomonas chloroacetimidivorans TaxID=1766656 RepID=UPI003C70DBB0
MRVLVDWARFSIGLAALVVVAVFVLGGGGYAEYQGAGFGTGAVLGGIVGLLVAGSMLGVAAAIVDMHWHSRQMIGLLKEQNAHLAALVRAAGPAVAPPTAEPPTRASFPNLKNSKQAA